ncbi:MAG: RNA polymerase sigma factor [Candidatus Spechtbacteria bacterium]|nr:RNA polymerase sigma factor [Candidatus Spechtbacteria bacterium]
MTDRQFQQLFSRVYDEYADQIFRFLFLKTNSRETAQDLSSEVFLRMWNYLISKNGHKAVFIAQESSVLTSLGGIQNVRAFLYKTARNCLIDYYRKQRPTVSYEDMLAAPETHGGIDEAHAINIDVENSLDIARIRQALSEIGEETAEIVTLHYLEDLPFSDIADIVGKPEGTVRVIAHRGVNALRERLKLE